MFRAFPAFFVSRMSLRLFASDDTIIENPRVRKYSEEFAFISHFFQMMSFKKHKSCMEYVKYPI